MKRLVLGASLFGALGCNIPTTCVARGTRIRTPKGQKCVEEFELGDEIWCVNPMTGGYVTSIVTSIQTSKRECGRLRFGQSELVVTSDHPIYCPDDGIWAPAGDWLCGDRHRFLHCGEDKIVTSTSIDQHDVFVGVFDVFDLTVAHELHNFVANGVLVHNKSVQRPECTLPDASIKLLINAPKLLKGFSVRASSRHTCEGLFHANIFGNLLRCRAGWVCEL